MIARILAPVRGNPILNRHLSTTFTGPRLGFAFLLVSTVLLILYGGLFTAASEGSLDPGITYFSHNAAVLGLLIVLLPLKVSGVIEGPRINRAFDQIAATGVAPATLYFGAWVSGLAYVALLLFVTIPFAACMVTFGDVEMTSMFWGYATLLAYSNVIIAVTLALSVFGREWLSTPIAVVVLFMVNIFSFIPDDDWVRGYPEILAELSPMRLILSQSTADVEFHPALRAADPGFLLWRFPVDVLRPVLWFLVVAVCALVVVIGPGHRFAAGLDNFGAVVLRGDRKRGILGRLRGGLTRRVEMAFFYENAPKWTHRWGFFLRYTLASSTIVLALGLLVSSCYSGSPAPLRPTALDDWRAMLGLCLGGGLLALWCLLSCYGRKTTLQFVPVGRWKIRHELFFAAVFAVLCGLYVLFMMIPLWEMEEWFRKGGRGPTGNQVRTRYGPPSNPMEMGAYVRSYTEMLWVIVVLAVDMFLISRLTSRLTNMFILARIYTALGFVLLLAVPSVLGVLIQEEELAPTFLPIATLSPGLLHPEYTAPGWLPLDAWSRFMTSHAWLAGVLLALLMIRYVRLALRRGPRGSSPVVGAVLVGMCVFAGELPAQSERPSDVQKPTPPVVVKRASRGFDGMTFGRGVDFYTVDLHNPNSVGITVEYWIEEESRQWGHRNVTLGAGSTKTLRWNDRPPNWNGRFGQGGGETKVAFRVGGKIVRSPPLDLIELSGWGRRNQRNPRVQRAKMPLREDQFLFLGKKGSFPPYWMDLAHAGNAVNLAVCEARSVSDSARNFDGLEVVWTDAEMLVSLTAPQQKALHHFVLLGGTVVFYGSLASSEIAATGAWETLLKPEAESMSTLDDKQLRHVQLPEGQNVLMSEDGGGVPILNTRSVGAGHIAHLAFPPFLSQTPKSLLSSSEFWSRLGKALPSGGFPIMQQGVSNTYVSADYSSLLMLGGYYLIYALGLSAGLLFFARRRKHRRRMWLQVFALPLLFVAFVPVLTSATERAPSLSEYTEVDFYRAESTEGVSTIHLTMNSSGKQSHDITFRGDMPVAYRPSQGSLRYRRYWRNRIQFSSLERIGMSIKGSGVFAVHYEIPPWAMGELFFYDTKTRAEPVRGTARLANTSTTLDVVIPEDLRGRKLFAIVSRSGRPETHPITVDSSGRARHVLKPDKNKRLTNGQQDLIFAHRGFFVGTAAKTTGIKTRVFVAAGPPSSGPGPRRLESDDLVFERSISVYEATRDVRYPRNRRWPQHREIRKVGDDYIEAMDQRLELFEIPVVLAR